MSHQQSLPVLNRITERSEIAARSFIVGYSSPKTRSAYSMHLTDWFRFCDGGGLDPMQASRVHVELWMRGLESKGQAPRTMGLKLTAVSMFYRHCVEEGWIESSPADRVRRPRVSRRSPRRPLSRGQLADFLDACGALGPQPRTLSLMLAFNGLRIGETLASNVEDLYHVGTCLVLHLPNRKGGKEGDAVVSQPLDVAMRESLDGRDRGPILLNQEGRRMTASNAYHIFRKARTSVRGEGSGAITPHVLRHTWVALALESGVPIHQVQRDGAWTDTRMVDYYHNPVGNPLRATTHSVAAFVTSAM